MISSSLDDQHVQVPNNNTRHESCPKLFGQDFFSMARLNTGGLKLVCRIALNDFATRIRYYGACLQRAIINTRTRPVLPIAGSTGRASGTHQYTTDKAVTPRRLRGLPGLCVCRSPRRIRSPCGRLYRQSAVAPESARCLPSATYPCR